MNDRFKFRFFDKKKQKMMYENSDFSDYCKDEWWGHEEQMALEALDVFDNPEHYILMQCTGLKDKNGKLIFEGDILELYVSTKKAYRYQVKYEIGSFMLVSDDEIFDFRNKWNDNVYPLSQLYFEYENEEDCIWECEVIGNIYENKELLNEI